MGIFITPPKTYSPRVRANRGRYDAEEMQPWRCVKCNEAVNKTTKRDCACTRQAKTKPFAPKS